MYSLRKSNNSFVPGPGFDVYEATVRHECNVAPQTRTTF